jgi:hypothetical protein
MKNFINKLLNFKLYYLFSIVILLVISIIGGYYFNFFDSIAKVLFYTIGCIIVAVFLFCIVNLIKSLKNKN